MTDPRRLLEGAGTDIECNLLAADRAEMPDAAAKRRAAMALAIGTASMWPVAAAATTKATTKASVSLAKLLLIGAAGVGALGTGYYLYSRSTATPSTATAQLSAPVRDPVSPAATARAAEDTTTPTAPAEGVTPFESLERERPAEPAHRAANAPAAPSAPAASISSEIRMLDAARRAQASGDGAGAIRALDEYKKQYPHGVLGEESSLLRIEALAKLGNLSAARALAQKFRAAHPDSPHLRRIDSVLAAP